jgi:hypothetical protein
MLGIRVAYDNGVLLEIFVLPSVVSGVVVDASVLHVYLRKLSAAGSK